MIGVDIGTSKMRVVIGSLASTDGPDGRSLDGDTITIVGVGEYASQGMRKGTIADIGKVTISLDKAMAVAEGMSGVDIQEAVVGINGSHIAGMASRGLITVDQTKPIGNSEVDRVIDAATQVKLSANREIVSVEPHFYKIDNQEGIRDPLDMSGVRLEVEVYMVTALRPNIKNLDQVLEQANLVSSQFYQPVGLVAANLALSDQQKENGAVMIDIGHSTTNIVVYEEGDVIFVKTLPVGSNNITTDLAIGLRADLDVAERVKLEHAVASPELRRGNEATVSLNIGNGPSAQKLTFKTELIDDIVEARLSELFELINKELKRIKKQANLPGGAVLTGGGAKLRGLVDYAREALGMNVHLYKMPTYKGLADKVKDPGWTVALGLMERDAQRGGSSSDGHSSRPGILSGIIGRIAGLFTRRNGR